MSAKQGEFVGPYEATGDETIRGRLSGPVVVRSGACLVVQGLLDGSVEVHADAALNVQGLFSANVLANEGLIMISGMATVTPWLAADPGRYAIATGTLIQQSDGLHLLAPDGSLRFVPPGNVNVDGTVAGVSDYFYFDAEEGGFVQLGTE